MADKVTKDVETHPCAKCMEETTYPDDQQRCSGCLKPEEYERKLCLPQSILEEIYG